MTRLSERPRYRAGVRRTPCLRSKPAAPRDRASGPGRLPPRAPGAVHRSGDGRGDRRWGIVGVSLRSKSVAEALCSPGSSLLRDRARRRRGQRASVGVLRAALHAPRNSTRCSPRSPIRQRIVSSTVTEKGYSHHPATGDLDLDDPAIRHDIAHPERRDHPGRAGRRHPPPPRRLRR